jgi:hypothetical protein
MKVVRLSALSTGCLIRQEIFLVGISVRGQVDSWAIVRQENRYQWKIPMKPSGIEPATFHSAVPQPSARQLGSIYSSMGRHSIAIRPLNPTGVYSCIHVVLPDVTGRDYGSQKRLQEPSQSEPSIFILISKTKCNIVTVLNWMYKSWIYHTFHCVCNIVSLCQCL